jgi:hypothetical protein
VELRSPGFTTGVREIFKETGLTEDSRSVSDQSVVRELAAMLAEAHSLYPAVYRCCNAFYDASDDQSRVNCRPRA